MMGPAQADQTQKSTDHEEKYNEANHVKVEPLPHIAKFRSLYNNLRKEVAGASGRPCKAFRWICDMDAAKSIEDLADIGEFETLDAKLAAGLGKVLHGELGRQIRVLEEKLAATSKVMLRGRQVLFLICDYSKITAETGQVMDFEDIMAVELKGDNVRGYLNDWELTLHAVKEVPSEDILESLVRRQLEKSNQLSLMMQLYNQDVIPAWRTTQLRKAHPNGQSLFKPTALGAKPK